MKMMVLVEVEMMMFHSVMSLPGQRRSGTKLCLVKVLTVQQTVLIVCVYGGVLLPQQHADHSVETYGCDGGNDGRPVPAAHRAACN